MSCQIRDIQATIDLLYENYFKIITITLEKA